MNNASRIIEAPREQVSEQLGGRRSTRTAKQRPFERGNRREVQTAIMRLSLSPPPPSQSTGPLSSVDSPEPCVLLPASRWVGGVGGVQVCAVGGTAAPPSQTLVPQARW